MFLGHCNLGFVGDFQSSLLRLFEQWFLARLDQSLPALSPVRGVLCLDGLLSRALQTLFPILGASVADTNLNPPIQEHREFNILCL